MSNDTIIEIFSGTLWEAELIKSMLQAAQINSFLKNATLNTYLLDPILAENVKVMINGKDKSIAEQIVKEFYNKR